ncbi:hypothetical protein NSTCB13_02787 [Nostoc sp. DSM 114160]|jgi:hypothetical protein
MLNKSLILSLLVLFAMAPAANAEVKLIAIGSLDGNIGDRSTETSAPLENGVPGNLLGGSRVGTSLRWQ